MEVETVYVGKILNVKIKYEFIHLANHCISCILISYRQFPIEQLNTSIHTTLHQKTIIAR